MNVKNIVALILLALSGVMAIFLYVRIKDKNEESQRIATVEAQVIESLLAIRKAENAYFAVKGEYTSNWDTLRAFVTNSKFYITERKETIIQREYGGDSVVVEIDTLSSVAVKDSIFAQDPGIVVDDLGKLPHEDTLFNIYTALYDDGSAVIEVVDSKPVNPKRQKRGSLRPIKFGSQNAPTTKGSWEK